jgi:F-type H+-transporting ATPase subunit delta
MAETKISRRYAKSLIDLGKERDIVSELYADMQLIQSTIRQNRQLALMFKSPIINTDKKDQILQEIFGSKIDVVTLTFLKIITRKNREYYIEDIASAFVSIYKVNKGIQTAQAITAAPLSDKLRNELLTLINKINTDKVELHESIDKNIIGGYILRWDDNQIDSSISKKLTNLRRSFESNLYLKDY